MKADPNRRLVQRRMNAMFNTLSAERSPALGYPAPDRQNRPSLAVASMGPDRGGKKDRFERASVRRFQSKEHIFCEGDPRTHVFQIEDGVVTIYQMLNDGRRQIVDFAYPGDFIGLGATGEHRFSAEATSSTRVRCFSASALEETARSDPSLALRLYKAVSLELSAARALLVAIGQRSAIERVSTFLLMIHGRTVTAKDSGNVSNVVHLPMRRADIGDFLGLTIETVSRTITKLRMMRVIEVSHGTSIRIIDVDRLANLSERQACH
jgi:CRP/FNR family transcriptional regulator, anaerobic regulatory protein